MIDSAPEEAPAVIAAERRNPDLEKQVETVMAEVFADAGWTLTGEPVQAASIEGSNAEPAKNDLPG